MNAQQWEALRDRAAGYIGLREMDPRRSESIEFASLALFAHFMAWFTERMQCSQ